jgi:hypothetical protein
MCAVLFQGAYCEIQSKEIIIIKHVISITAIIAIIFICAFYLGIVVMDVPKVGHYVRFRDHVYRRDLIRPVWRYRPQTMKQKRKSVNKTAAMRYLVTRGK